MKQYIVDAFTDKIFHGNQAAVCVLDKWLSDDMMMHIAVENNFSETAFTVKENNGYRLRWFTPGGEINLCGHATLAASYILFKFYEKESNQLVFHTLSGDLYIQKKGSLIIMDFPAYHCTEVAVTAVMGRALGAVPEKAYLDRDLLLVYKDENTVRKMNPNFEMLKQLEGSGVAVTAPGTAYHCISRFFAPKLKVNEDPVTGSAHCMIIPYWAEKLGKNEIKAYQASERGGELYCELNDDRVKIAGTAVLFAECEIYLSK